MSADAPLSDSDPRPREPSLRGQTSHDRSTPANRGPETPSTPKSTA